MSTFFILYHVHLGYECSWFSNENIELILSVVR
jgi:hypothetical protein